MEFWGVEVKSGQSFDVVLGEGEVLHLSQACLGEYKKDSKDAVCLSMTVNDKKLVLGTLHPERLPQQLFDLVFDKDFQISHNSKNTSVYFYGYKAEQPSDDHVHSEDFDSEEEDEELPLPAVNVKQEAKKEEKAVVVGKKEEKAAGKQKVKIVEPAKDSEDDDDDSEDDSDAMDADSDDDEENEDSSDDEEDSDEEDETPKKQQSGKKRPNESASKTPVSEKKAKNSTTTPQKTEGKKGGAVHIATPHPSKGASKTPAGGSKSNQKSPASAADGAHSCKACNRNFKTEGALSSHNQAKHTTK